MPQFARKKGQRLCLWTPLGPEAPDPHLTRTDLAVRHERQMDFKGSAFNGVQGQSPWPSPQAASLSSSRSTASPITLVPTRAAPGDITSAVRSPFASTFVHACSISCASASMSSE